MPAEPGPDRDTQRAALGRIVAREAQRLLSEALVPPDPARVAAGWERRFIADAARAEEVMALYADLGYEVAADLIRPQDLPDDCEDCLLVALMEYRIIYTRRLSAPRETS
jgi:hypothetical protein